MYPEPRSPRAQPPAKPSQSRPNQPRPGQPGSPLRALTTHTARETGNQLRGLFAQFVEHDGELAREMMKFTSGIRCSNKERAFSQGSGIAKHRQGLAHIDRIAARCTTVFNAGKLSWRPTQFFFVHEKCLRRFREKKCSCAKKMVSQFFPYVR